MSQPIAYTISKEAVIKSISATHVIMSSVQADGDNRVITPDENGVYRGIYLGAINVNNSAGAFYIPDVKTVAEILNDKSQPFARQLTNGYLQGEKKHPDLPPPRNKEEAMAQFVRNMTVDPDRASHSILKVELFESNIPGPSGGKIIIFKGDIQPLDNEFGRDLKSQLDNPKINVAFSIRCGTIDTVVNGKVHKSIKTIVTWDWVKEPGIWLASKWHTVGTSTESYQISQPSTADQNTGISIDYESFREIYKNCEDGGIKGIAKEDNDALFTSLKKIDVEISTSTLETTTKEVMAIFQ